ncbi:Ig-like domain-containing protein, partial [Verrucomicrobiota bacterium]
MKKTTLIVWMILSGLQMAYADVALNGLFSDGCVIQRNTNVPVWGTAESGESVSVSFAGQVKKTKADRKGCWRVDLDPMKANATGQVMVVKGEKNTVEITDVLIGEVWFCSGQSNINNSGGDETWSETKNIRPPYTPLPNARGCRVMPLASPDPEDVLNPNVRLARIDMWRALGERQSNVVGTHFARALHKNLNGIPIGMISFSMGGSKIEVWIPKETMLSTPEMSARYHSLTNRSADKMAAIKAGGRGSIKGNLLNLQRSWPGFMFESGLPLVYPYAIKGVLWWQGESNRPDIGFYAVLQEAMVSEWRARWNRDFAFIYTQIETVPAAMPYPDAIQQNFVDSGMPDVRFLDTQWRYMELDDNSAMGCTVDLGDGIHPGTKPDIGARLALAALGHCYGQSAEHIGPTLNKAVYDQGIMYLHFDHAKGLKPVNVVSVTPEEGKAYTLGEDGVIIKRARKGLGSVLVVQDDPSARPRSFVVADTNGFYHEAMAEISNNVVILKLPGGVQVAAVAGGSSMRGDKGYYLPNIYNSANLPLVAFYETNFTYTAPDQAPPVVKNDSFTGSENAEVVVEAPGILANDWDCNGDSFSIELVKDVSNGKLQFRADGGFTYTPSKNFVGVDAFTYRGFDDAYGKAAKVSITVEENIPPVSGNNTYVVKQGNLLTVDAPGILINDSDINGSGLTALVVDNPGNGNLKLNPDGSFTYKPARGYTGSDNFTYRANDGTDDGNTASVEIKVKENMPPDAGNDSYWAKEGFARTIPVPGVLWNDSDPNKDVIVSKLLSKPAHGTVVLNSDGSFVYTPTGGACTDSFTYRAYDGKLYSAPATVTVNVLKSGSELPPDFKVSRGSFTIPNGTAFTLKNGVHYTLDPDTTISNAFIRVVNAYGSGAGDAGRLDIREALTWIENPENLLESVTFRRSRPYPTTTEVSWELIEYVGDFRGANEIVVRDQACVDIFGNVGTITGAVVSSVSSTNRVMVYITGQAAGKGGNSFQSAYFTADFNSSREPVFARNISTGSGGGLSYAVVEFTGDNWNDVQRVEHMFKAKDVVEKEIIKAVDSSRAFMHVQCRTSHPAMIGGQVWFSAGNELSFITYDSGPGLNTLAAWIVENRETDPAAAMKVQHVKNARPAGGTAPDVWTETIRAVRSMDNSSIMGESAKSSASYKNAMLNFELTSEDTVRLYRRIVDIPSYYTFSVVEWPKSSPKKMDVSVCLLKHLSGTKLD